MKLLLLIVSIFGNYHLIYAEEGPTLSFPPKTVKISNDSCFNRTKQIVVKTNKMEYTSKQFYTEKECNVTADVYQQLINVARYSSKDLLLKTDSFGNLADITVSQGAAPAFELPAVQCSYSDNAAIVKQPLTGLGCEANLLASMLTCSQGDLPFSVLSICPAGSSGTDCYTGNKISSAANRQKESEK